MLGSVKLVYHIDGDGNNLIDTFDFLNFAQGFELADGGWIPSEPTGPEVVITETLTFVARALSQDDLAVRLQVLDEWITRVNYYREKTMRTGVWLRVKFDDESEPRQALVSSLSYKLNASPFGATWQYNNFISDLVIVIERSAYWEELTAQTDDVSALNYLSDAVAVETGGDVPARVFNIQFNATAAARQNSAWFGFKDDRYYNPTLFYPVRALNGYEAGAGTDATFVNDTTAMGGKKTQVTFGTPTLVQRHNLPMKYVTTFVDPNITIETLTEDRIRGEYLCLMKANITSTAVVRARIKVGYQYATTGDRIYPRVTINSTTRNIYEMGVISIPQDRSSVYNSAIDTSIKLDAELVSGSGNLEVDCYILIPLNGSVKFYSDDGFISAAGASNRLGLIETNPLGETYGYTTNAAPQIYDVAILDIYQWGMPVSVNAVPGVLVCALASDANGSLNTTSWAATVNWIRRWRTMRGNE